MTLDLKGDEFKTGQNIRWITPIIKYLNNVMFVEEKEVEQELHLREDLVICLTLNRKKIKFHFVCLIKIFTLNYRSKK